MLLNATFWGFVAARLGYIAQWWEEYAQSPMSMIAIGDQGFSWWVGVLAALALIGWRTRSSRALRHPVNLGSYAGRPVVLNLWASWCPPCRREMPVFELAEVLGPR